MIIKQRLHLISKVLKLPLFQISFVCNFHHLNPKTINGNLWQSTMHNHAVFMTITIMYLHVWLYLFSNNQQQLMEYIIDEW